MRVAADCGEPISGGTLCDNGEAPAVACVRSASGECGWLVAECGEVQGDEDCSDGDEDCLPEEETACETGSGEDCDDNVDPSENDMGL